MVSQREAARRFAAGTAPGSIPQASNVTAADTSEPGYDAVILGYGHAIYAARRDDGSVVIFDGWRGFSVSTGCQLTEVEKGVEDARGDRYGTTDSGRPGQRHNQPAPGECDPRRSA